MSYGSWFQLWLNIHSSFGFIIYFFDSSTMCICIKSITIIKNWIVDFSTFMQCITFEFVKNFIRMWNLSSCCRHSYFIGYMIRCTSYLDNTTDFRNLLAVNPSMCCHLSNNVAIKQTGWCQFFMLLIIFRYSE